MSESKDYRCCCGLEFAIKPQNWGDRFHCSLSWRGSLAGPQWRRSLQQAAGLQQWRHLVVRLLFSCHASILPKSEPCRYHGQISPLELFDSLPKVDKMTLTGAEVAKHNSKDSCWVIIHGKAYDVTEFLPEHPGGPKIILKYVNCIIIII